MPRPWTEEEDADLLAYDEHRWPLIQTSAYLYRSEEDCKERLQALKPNAAQFGLGENRR